MRQYLLRCFGTTAETGNRALVVEQHNFSPAQKQEFATTQNLQVCVFIDNNSATNFSVDFYYPHRQSPLCLHGSLAAAQMFFNFYPHLNQAVLLTAAGQRIKIQQHNSQISLAVIPQVVLDKSFSHSEIAQLLGINLTQIKEKGTIAQEYLKNELEAAVRQEKKATQLSEKLIAAAAGASNMQQIAQKAGVAAQVANGLNFAFPVIPGIAREPEVVGNVFSLAKGKISKPIIGGKGVYVVTVDNFIEAMQLPDYNAKKVELAAGVKSRVDQELLEALKNKADIKDNRIRFY